MLIIIIPDEDWIVNMSKWVTFVFLFLSNDRNKTCSFSNEKHGLKYPFPTLCSWIMFRKRLTYDIPQCYINVLIPKRVEIHGRYKSTFHTRVSPTQQRLLKTRFLSRAASRAIFFEAFPADLETPSHANRQTVKCARKPKSSSRTCWIDVCSELEVLT